jgi:Fic family protein
VAKRAARGSQLVRGFLLGMMHAKGHVLTTARIRNELKASKATAKRDMQQIARLVTVTPSKPIAGLRNHIPRRTLIKETA